MGFTLDYPTIGLHAISRDVSAYPQEHLYVMVNGKLTGEGQTTHNNVFGQPNHDYYLFNADQYLCDDDLSTYLELLRCSPKHHRHEMYSHNL